MSLFEPGWHSDPDGPADQLRYWDGQRWTDQVKPVDSADLVEERRHQSRLAAWMGAHRALAALVALVVVGVVAVVLVASRQAGAGSDGGDTLRRAPKTPAKSHHSTSRPSRGPVNEPEVRRVVRIVDGDTLELGNGETVRLVGIDTPEVGECGYHQAAHELSRLVLGEDVGLVAPDENRDRYGRLLRYVNVGSLDAGLQLIRDGLAVARYDSRDGYGFHPRQPVYVKADRATDNVSCGAPGPRPLIGNNSRCAPGYTPCVPPYPPDVDCADVNGPITVTGSDPHELDADGDGIACEE